MDKKVPFQTTLNKQLLDQIKIQAIKENCNVNDILEKLIKEYLNSKQVEDGS